jgi:hypothetical protein
MEHNIRIVPHQYVGIRELLIACSGSELIEAIQNEIFMTIGNDNWLFVVLCGHPQKTNVFLN